MEKRYFDWKEYAKISRLSGAEGIVLLENEDEVLPLSKGKKVSIFGRAQLNYYKSGMGSGGMVNTPYVVDIIDGLKAAGIEINEELYAIYKEWEKTHPYDKGNGWATEWWSQEEMVLTKQLVEDARKQTDVAIIVIGRSAGEDRDSEAVPGSFLLQEEEEIMLSLVCAAYEKTIVLLNVGNILDMSWVKKYQPKAVLYTWQGGCEGGNAIADVLTGDVNPSGRLADTIAGSFEDYPSTKYFGDETENIYVEDIYVGYRYFESAAKDKVLYPFGYGLSYTEFIINTESFSEDEKYVYLSVKVTNIGKYRGKQVVQVYYNPAQGELNKPVRNLIRYGKTKELDVNESEILTFKFLKSDMSSYDDGGYTGNKACYVLEPGEYEIYAGFNVREAELAGVIIIDNLIVTSKLQEALAPVKAFDRMVITNGEVSYQPTPLRTIDYLERIKKNIPKDRLYTGDKGYKLSDVYDVSISMDDFLNQLNNEDLICLSRGEGMCSPKVTGGIAGSFGGVTNRLKAFGIPIAGVADGPSGIRMDNGSMAFQIPNGTALACTFNNELVTELFNWIGFELLFNKIDSLLGPGLNIHRNPLNGRNFEYFSEDPYLTGAMTVAELKGMHKYGVTGTIKHFALNNQETQRHNSNSIVSERAAREIYLKAFEMAVKEANAYSIMTSYNPINGIWTAGNYDLNTIILREEWDYQGFVMTDWWAKISDDEGKDAKENTDIMIRSQNDVYMVNADAASNSENDHSEKGFYGGVISRGELLRNAKNICRVVMRSPVMERSLNRKRFEIVEINRPECDNGLMVVMPASEISIENGGYLNVEGLKVEAGLTAQFPVKINEGGTFTIKMKLRSPLNELAQINTTVAINKTVLGVVAINGTGNEWVYRELVFGYPVAQDMYLEFYFGQAGIEIGEIEIKKTGEYVK